MSRKQEIFEKVLKNKYVHDEFVGFTREFLNDIQLVAPNTYNKEYSNFSFYVAGYYHIGNYITDDGDVIAVLSVNLNRGETVERARSMQRNFVKTLIERNGCAGAIVAFYTAEEPEKWRLSFIRMDYEFSKGKVDQKLTPAKRYSYLVGEKEPCTTALQRLFPIFDEDNERPSLDEIEDAFSVEKVTKDFFDKYVEKYHDLREYLDGNEDFVIEAKTRGFTSEQFAKKLLGQIVFLYFIQKKGWLGVNAIPVVLTEKEYNNAFYAKGAKSREIVPQVYQKVEEDKYKINVAALQAISDEDEAILATCVKGDPWGTGPRDFMRQIFKGCIAAGKNFFDDYLEPLFYTGLNLNRGENGFYAPFHRRIPFLNGGLFEQLDNYDWEHNDFNIPNEIFSNVDEKGRDADGILDIFDRYNFTMNEDEPMEREVAIDPEMLGKVFENLLDVKDRKSKGAFYTPREIVHYMCQETLINYLVEKTGISEAAIRDYILYGDFFKDEDTEKTKKVFDDNGKYHYEIDTDKELYISEEIFSFKKNVNRLEEIDELLKNVKVADMAVGSGAFPLGMLNEIVKARETLTAYMSIGMNNFQKKSFIAYGRKLYDLKINTIKNCIFACDIEPSAVDIAKLRLWLSIVIDDEITEGNTNGAFDEHSKPRQLPNLECNIICGDSLVDEFKGTTLITKSQVLNNDEGYQYNLFNILGVDTLIEKLIELQDKLFFVKEHNEKEEIKEQIKNIYYQIVAEQLSGSNELLSDYYEAIKNPSLPFILWQLYFPKVFKDNGGFDIVIGNPPYIKIQNLDESAAEVLKKKYKTATGKFDIYVLFVEKAFELMTTNGQCAFIQPHRFLNVGYGKGLREYLKERQGLSKVVSFGVNQVFETATTYTGIFFYSRNNPLIKYAEVETKDMSGLEFMTKEWKDLGSTWSFSTESTNSIVEKINSTNVNLLDVFEGIYQGVITLGDDKFIMEGRIEGDTFYGYSNEIGKDVELEAAIMKPVLKGENIRRYLQPQNTLYIIYPHKTNEKGKTVPYEEEEMIEQFPKTYEYLSLFKEELLEKKVKYKTNPKYWYSLHRAREKRILDADKLITPQLQNYCNFALDTKSMYPDAGGYMLIIKDEFKSDILYYYGILNSSLFYHFIKETSTAFNNNYYYFKTAYIKPFKFPNMDAGSEEKKERIAELVDIILQKRADNDELPIDEYEKEIDQLVFELYGLSSDEIAQIEKKYNVK